MIIIFLVAMAPCAVAILVFGAGTPQGKNFLRMYDAGGVDCYEPVDIRDIMKRDPGESKHDKVLHSENSEYTRTMYSLLNGEHFVEAIYHVSRMMSDTW